MKLTRPQIYAIAAEAQCDPRTVERIYDGQRSKALVRDRVVAAVKKLKMPALPNAEQRVTPPGITPRGWKTKSSGRSRWKI